LKTTPKIHPQAIVQQQVVQNTKTVENKETISHQNVSNVSKEIDAAVLQHHWTQFVEVTFKDKKPLVYNALSNNSFKIQGNTIEVPITNLSSLENMLKEPKEQIIVFLRKVMNNNHLQLQFAKTIGTDEQTPKRYFTPTDKFKKLVEKYPLLDELRQNLGLDLDI
jgi:DNA polymerase-3 subunit gamma/tau